MDMIYVFRGRIQELYAKNSKVFDKIFQFILAIVTFTVINHNVGFMKAAASPVASLALAVICTFLPLMVTVIMATVLILAHMFALSIGMLAVTAVIFLIMYIFYLRLTPKKALIVLLTPLAFFLKVPYIIPVACGLVATPISLIAISCGTIVYYMLEYVKKSSVNIENVGAKGMLTQATKYVQQVFQNKEMWIIIVAFIICFFVVFTLRRTSMDHAWKVAIVAGAVANVIVIVAGDIALGVHTSYGTLIGGNIGAIVIGLILELFLFSVDYARSENLQFEDDEYFTNVLVEGEISNLKNHYTGHIYFTLKDEKSLINLFTASCFAFLASSVFPKVTVFVPYSPNTASFTLFASFIKSFNTIAFFNACGVVTPAGQFEVFV